MYATLLMFQFPCYLHTIEGAVEATPRMYPSNTATTTTNASTRTSYDNDKVLDLTGLQLIY